MDFLFPKFKVEAFSFVLLLHLILAICMLIGVVGVRMTLESFQVVFWFKLLTFQLAVSLLLSLGEQNEMEYSSLNF